MPVNLGYACINTTLQKSDKVMCNRGMIKRTWLAKGLPYASQIALSNVSALQRVVRWNIVNDISVYRISSCLFPWMSEYSFTDLPDYTAITSSLAETGRIARAASQRLSFHPGQFCVLASPNELTVLKTIKELDQTAQVMDMLGMPRTPQSKINIHVGGAYGERDIALSRFCKNFELLSSGAQARLTVENDDKPNLYSTAMLYHGVHERLGVPIVFDSHHFDIGPQDQDYHDAFYMARSTWPAGIRQQCHHSNSRRQYEDPTANKMAHSTWYYTPFDAHGEDVDVVLECKAKELALFKYQKDFMAKEIAV